MEYQFGPLAGQRDCRFRVWAPGITRAEVIFKDKPAVPMSRAEAGFWEANCDAPPGTAYKFRLDGREVPDPASRWQEEDTDGWSVVCAPIGKPALEEPLRPWHEAVLCEVHIGTATPEGTFKGLMDRLEHYRDAGYTTLEIMPINAFPGNRNWGYDGTLIYAPDNAYGTREELRALLDRAHELGLCMVLDVVYNHFGEVDNFIRDYAPEWFDEKIDTPWGPGVDFSKYAVRRFYCENACMWVGEFDFDGLRFDSVHEIKSDGSQSFLRELAETIRSVKSHAKLIIENMDNIASWLERDETNTPKTYTAQWNDDIHHVLNFLVTGESKNGYSDPSKDPIADLEKSLADGFVHDGEADEESDGRTRGEPASRLPLDAFVSFVQNHDQIGNRADSKRLPDRIGAEKLDFLHFVTLLAPQIPLFFMGEEGHLRTSFPFFIDLEEADAEKKRQERDKQMVEMFKETLPPGGLPDPNDPATFESAKLDWQYFETEAGRASLERFRTLTAWRREILWPLAATPCCDAHTARQGNCIILTWTFEGGYLSMALNPTDMPADIACSIDRRPVSTGEFCQHDQVLRLGPWSAVAW